MREWEMGMDVKQRIFRQHQLLQHVIAYVLLCSLYTFFVSADTDDRDAASLRHLHSMWANTPSNWGSSSDPCGTNPWDGVNCSNSRITALTLSSLGITGDLSEIRYQTQLEILDLSYNPGFSGPIPPEIGQLSSLKVLIISGCSFTGSIPAQLGDLAQLTFLALNNNNLTGTIPPSLGKLTNLYKLDVSYNQLTGNIPVSDGDSPGLDQLLTIKHFHIYKNQLSGSIPSKLFSSEMILTEVLFDGNQLSGSIPSTLGLVTTLQVLRLDRNSLSGTVPSNLNNLSNLNELNLANNKLTGPLPNLTALNSLNYVDLSNNSFDASLAPSWFQTIPSLTTLIIEYGSLGGAVPSSLFSLPALQKVSLRNNSFNGTLDMGNYISPSLQYVDFQNNQISARTVGNYQNTLLLFGNPGCSSPDWRQYCQKQALQTPPAYSTSSVKCGQASNCGSNQLRSPKDCKCAYPYQGVMHFRAPYFSDFSNKSAFGSLELKMWVELGPVFLQNPYFDFSYYMVLSVAFFKYDSQYLSSSDVVRIGFALSNQSFRPPHEFGPYYFIASPYYFHAAKADNGSKPPSSGVITGIAVGCSCLIFLLLIFVVIYTIRKKRRDEMTIVQNQVALAYWPGGTTNNRDIGDAPHVKGPRWFHFREIKKCTNNFSDENEIGSGGYGKVYRGILPGGQMVAVKRAQQGSTQGAHEFKTEIELLSGVHHKNVVTLVGFYYDRRELMLVYEFIPNGTLRESLSGESGVLLDWKKRLWISLDSAKGLAYLHELANPPIIHRDVKSSNILLDENLNGKVGDFGLSKLIADCTKGHVSTQVKGTIGYLDPEYYMTQQLTEKSDVYSFGVVMLELVTGKQPIEKGKYVVREVRAAMDGMKELYCLTEMLDPAIVNAATLPGLVKFVDLAMKCVEEKAADRPTMSEVVKEIETIMGIEGVLLINLNPASTSTTETDIGTSKEAPVHPYTSDTFSLSTGASSSSFNPNDRNAYFIDSSDNSYSGAKKWASN